MSVLTRRDFLAGGALAVGALATGAGRAGAARARFDGTIRVGGLGYDLLEPIRRRAGRDLDLRIVSAVGPPPVIQRWVRQQPGAFDILSCFAQDIAEFWTTGNLQPLEIARIRRWKDVTPLYRLGKLHPRDARCAYGQGDAPFRKLYLDPDRSDRWRSAPGAPRSLDRLLVQWADEATGKPVGPEPRLCTGLPGTFNLDSFGYNAKALRKRPEELSWAELVNRRWTGRVALIADPHVGLQDGGNAVQAAGLMRFGDLGDPTRREIDRFVKILLALRKKGQFFNVWNIPSAQPVEWMRAGEVVIGSLFAGQVAALAALGFPIRQAAPREGYRAFAGLLSISAEVTDPAKLDACYDFLNWWHSGYGGAVLLRQGYYTGVQATSRRFMAPGEYGYWMEGEPADRTYGGAYGDASVRKGRVRDGGSFATRACRISSWNSIGTQDEYLLKRWQEFVSSF